MSIFVEFTLWFLLAEAIVTAVWFPLRKKQIKPAVRGLLIAAKAILGVVLGALVMAGPVQLRVLQPLLLALYVALFMDAFADLLYTVIQKIRKKDRRPGVFKAVSLLFGVLFFVYGVVNMEVVTPAYHTYTSDKLKEEHTVVFIADLHVGSAQPFSVTEKTVEAVRALAPDCVILGGDIVDDYTTKEEMENTFRLFSDFGAPVYYLYGNHDRQGHAEYAGGKKFSQEELEAAMTGAGVVILKDEFARVSPDLLILGREDITEGEGRADARTLQNPDPDAFLIVADHQPVQFKENLAVGTDLQLSGHTHAGQLFPLGPLYDLIGYNCGDYAEGDAIMNVSPGACGWRMPIRTQAHCRYEVITLKPAA